MKKRKTGIRQFKPPPQDMLHQSEVDNLVMPLHVTLPLLSMGAFSTANAHDFAGLMMIGQLSAKAENKPAILKAGSDGAAALISMRNRVRAGEPWTATPEEHTALATAVMTLDRWFKSMRRAQFQYAISKAYRALDEAEARGFEELDLLTEEWK